MNKDFFRFQFVSCGSDAAGSVCQIRQALEGGCRWVQLRMKYYGAAEGLSAHLWSVRQAAAEVRRMTAAVGATFILDDYVDLCAEVGADGVHLGAEDMAVGTARRRLGDTYIIGATCHDASALLLAERAGATYAGCGPWRWTATKRNLASVLGFEGLRAIVSEARSLGCRLPVVAIGGLTLADVEAVFLAGAQGVAVSGAVAHAEDPVDASRQFCQLCLPK